MNNKVVNKQIPIESIVKVADYLEDYKEKYDKKFELEENRNKNIPYGEKQWEYENGSTALNYEIEFKSGKRIKESNYNWFVGNLNQLEIIKSITIDLYITFYTKGQNSTVNDVFNKVYISLYFRENDVTIDIDTNNQENEAHNLYAETMNILEDNEDRYNKTMKHRKIRTQCFTIAIGIILSYILYIILKINQNNMPEVLTQYMSNKYLLIFGQWFVAILLGNIFSYWYIVSAYKPLLPDTQYAGWDSYSNKATYKDDTNDFTEHSEVHFGQFWDAEKRRSKIEKIYKVTRIVLLVQLVISAILFLILK